MPAVAQNGGAVHLWENTEAVVGNCSFVGNTAGVSLRPASGRLLSPPPQPLRACRMAAPCP